MTDEQKKYAQEDRAYMNVVSRELDKFKVDNEIRRRMFKNISKEYGYEVGVKRLIDKGDELKNGDNPIEATRQYLDALWLMKEYREKHKVDDLWCRKVICMACNGMGIVYAKLGKLFDAIENFQDAIDYAPTDEARKVAERNLEKYKKVVKEKTGTNVHTY